MRNYLVLDSCRELVCVTGPITPEPPGVIELPLSLRGSVDLEAPTCKPIVTSRQDDSLGNFEWFEESLELRRVVKFYVFSGVQIVVDRCGEQSPALGLILVDS